MTFAMAYAYSEHFVLPISHDEVVHGKGSLVARMPGDRWQQLANLRAYFGYMWAHPGRKVLFMGSEFAQSTEWSADEGLDWWLLQFDEHLGVQRALQQINRVYRATPALWQRDDDPGGFEWIDANDAGANVFSWIRWDDRDRPAVSVSNMSPLARTGYRLGLPAEGQWVEILNTDATEFGGSGVGNLGAVTAHPSPCHGHPFSAEVTLPPLSTLWLRHEETGA